MTPRPLYWSLRRELWENRSVYLGPLIVTAIVLFASLVNTIAKPAAMARPFKLAPAPIMLAAFIVAAYYCLESLNAERRDRSILFWKSLPVSDRTVVLSKVLIALVVLPLIAYALSVATQIVLVLGGTLSALARGMSPADFLGELGFFPNLVIMLYGLTVHALWFAPIYGWLLLMSGWSKRGPLWGVLPFVTLALIERIVLGTTHVSDFLRYRVVGAMAEAFLFDPSKGGNIDRFSELTPGRFLATPSLWLGLLFAAACIAIAIRVRRLREPI